MKELTQLQKQMLDHWVRKAESSTLKASEIVVLDQQLGALINSIEYEKPFSYFPRIK